MEVVGVLTKMTPQGDDGVVSGWHVCRCGLGALVFGGGVFAVSVF